MNTAPPIEQILKQFQIQVSEFDVVNIEVKKGWSSRYLYLIVAENGNYLLKGKSEEQLKGYEADIEISNYLGSKNFSVRNPIKTNSGEFHFVLDDIYWELKTYTPGEVLEFKEYNDASIISLAKINTRYINCSLNKEEIKRLNLTQVDVFNSEETLERIRVQKDVLTEILGDEVQKFTDWFMFAQKEVDQILAKNLDFSIIHNDLNNKNILLDLHTKEVISFIDWDHGCISSPLKDVLEPLNNMYDHIPQNYEHVKNIYLKEINANYHTGLSFSETSFLQTYVYALSKWKFIYFHAKLIKDLGNSTGELSNFEGVVKEQLISLNSMGELNRVF